MSEKNDPCSDDGRCVAGLCECVDGFSGKRRHVYTRMAETCVDLCVDLCVDKRLVMCINMWIGADCSFTQCMGRKVVRTTSDTESGVVTHGAAQQYSNNQHCQWLIIAPESASIALQAKRASCQTCLTQK